MVKIEGLVEVSVLAMYFVQALGKSTPAEVYEKINAIGADVNLHTLEQAIEALQARGLISYARGKSAGGQSVRMFKPRQIVWAAPPEVAHVSVLLPALVETEEARTIVETLNEGEAKGDGEKKAMRELGYDHYADVEATLLTMDEMLGSQPSSPRLDELLKRSPHGRDVDAMLRFWRDEDGALLIGSDVVRGWLRTGLRTQGFADAAAAYVGASPIRIVPSRSLVQAAFPVVDQRGGGGKGITSYECLRPGERLTVRFRFPTKGFMSVDAFKLWLAAYGPNPVRGLSPARGGRFGKVALVGFVEKGETRSAKNMLEAVVGQVPKEAAEFYEQLLREADGVSLRKGSSK